MLNITQIAELAKNLVDKLQGLLGDKLKLTQQNAELSAKVVEQSEEIAQLKAEIAELREADAKEDAGFEAEIVTLKAQAKEAQDALTALKAEKGDAEAELNAALTDIQALLQQ